LTLIMIGCADASFTQPDPRGVAALDEASFRCAIEPIFQRECIFLGCHGREAMPFRLYGVGALRITGGQTSAGRAQALTDKEHHANFLAAQGQSFHVRAEDNQLVLKCLPPAAGGYAHIGGAIWTGKDDPRVQLLEQWLAGQALPCSVPDAGP
jgi:hypothetical protein